MPWQVMCYFGISCILVLCVTVIRAEWQYLPCVLVAATKHFFLVFCCSSHGVFMAWKSDVPSVLVLWYWETPLMNGTKTLRLVTVDGSRISRTNTACIHVIGPNCFVFSFLAQRAADTILQAHLHGQYRIRGENTGARKYSISNVKSPFLCLI